MAFLVDERLSEEGAVYTTSGDSIAKTNWHRTEYNSAGCSPGAFKLGGGERRGSFQEASPRRRRCASQLDGRSPIRVSRVSSEGVVPRKIASAALDEGDGVYDLTPDFRLTVPAETYGGNYAATATIAINVGP